MSTKTQRDEWQRLSDAVMDKSGHERGCMTDTLADAVPALLQDVERLTAALNASRIAKSPAFVSISFYDKDIETHNARIDAALLEVTK